MRILGNIIWHVPFQGYLSAFYTFVTGCVMCITIIGIPMGLSLFQLAGFLLAPFSCEMIDDQDLIYLGRRKDGRCTVTKIIYTILKILYFPFGLLGVICATLLMIVEAITLVGIPCAMVWWKIIPTIMNPFGKVCVSRTEADLINTRKYGKF